MKIEPGKFYKTRGGRKARIYAVESEGTYPIHGAIQRSNEVWVCASWLLSGRGWEDRKETPDDIVSEWRDEPRVFWVNVYADSEGCWYSPAYESRARADENASPDRIECIRVVESPEDT